MTRTKPDLARLSAAALLILAALAMPDRPEALAPAALWPPLELPLILAALAALPAGARLTRVARAALVAALLATALLNLADLGTRLAYGRGFNPLVDLHLVDAAWNLASGTLGAVPAALAAASALAATAGLGAALWWSTGRWAALAPPPRFRAAAGALALAAGVAVVLDVGAEAGAWRIAPPGKAPAAGLAYARTLSYGATLADLRAFAAAARADPFTDRHAPLAGLGGRDVLLIFVESYGRGSLASPLYAPTHAATLRDAERRLTGAGLAARSGWLTAPIRGGQSWLAHATLASGLWISDQGRYRAYLASERASLFDFAVAAGYRTAAVMPAITMDWPEGGLMNFGTILAAADLGYRGQPFNWVTMPDQYTLAALDRLLERGDGAPPLFAQVALISSHAPWVPIPPVIAWDAVGDGSVFDAFALSGDPPEVVWRDQDRVRDQYRLAIDYSLRTVAQYALRQAGDPPLMVILGDHQPARFVSQSDSFDVPVHVVGPPDLIARLDGWAWSDGLVPAPDAPVWRMDAFRDRFLAAFGAPAPTR
jgi:hypothetical protein